jgi:hypothetical protein
MFTVINRNATGHDNMTKNRMEIGSEKMGLQQLLCSKKMDSWALVWESWPHCRLNCNSYVSLPEGIMLCSDNLIIFDD